MKIFLGLFIASSFLSVAAFASGGVKIATIKTFSASRNWKDLAGLSQGIIEVDEGQNKVKLILIHSNPSLDNVEVELPIIQVKANACNDRTITAFRDRSSLDGPKETVVIIERSHCGDFSREPLTQVTYDETGGWTSQGFHAEFLATTLK